MLKSHRAIRHISFADTEPKLKKQMSLFFGQRTDKIELREIT